MKYQLVLTNRSLSDIEKARAWYNKQQTGLGTKFSDAVFKGIEVVHNNPEGNEVKYRFTREKLIKKFPYLIIYSVEENIIFILRVFHCKQSPKKKHR